MKASQPQLSAKWWSAVRPSGVDEKKNLEKALSKAEKALGDQQKKSDDPKAIDGCLTALKALPTAISKTVKECDKKTHKDELKGLQDLKKLVDSEATRLKKLQKELQSDEGAAGEEESDDKIFEKDYLHKLIKLIKSGNKELNFAFGLDMNAPEACDLLLHRKKGPEMLFKILKKTKKFPNRLLTYGTAKMDPEDKQTLTFQLAPNANIPPNKIVRIGRKMFQQDKKLRFKKLKVVAANGQTLEDAGPEEPTEGTAGAVADLSQQRSMVEGFMQSWDQALNEVSSQVGNIRKAMASMRDDPAVSAIYDGLAAYDGLSNVQREFPDLDLSKLLDAATKDDQALYDQTLTQTAREVGQARTELTELRPLLNALDENPFGIPTNADDTVTRVLEEIASGLGV